MHPELIANVYNDLAAFCLEKRKWQSAIEAYQRVLDMHPDLVDPYYFMGVSYMNLFENQSAIRMFTTFLQHSENNPEKKGERYSAQKMLDYIKGQKRSK